MLWNLLNVLHMKRFHEDEARFKELVLYVSQKCAYDPRFGSTKLNKILFYADFLAYAELGNPITGFEYQKLSNGPAPRRLLPIRKQMIEAGELGLQESRLKTGKIMHRIVNLRSPNLNLFTGPEISLIDSVIETLAEANADTVSALSHRMVGWKVSRMGETIPYETVFLSDEPLTSEDIQRGLEVAREFDVPLVE